jgi:hypothetical protein
VWRRDTTPPSYAAAQQQVQAALQQLGLATGQQQLAAAMSAVETARVNLRSAQYTAWATSERLQRQEWLHRGEQPNPCITEQLRALERSPTAHKVVALRTAVGSFVWEGAGPASVAIAQWAGVSAQPTVDTAAQADILAAVGAFPREPAAANGNPVVTEAEVLQALKDSKPNTSPGLDGLPVAIYKNCSTLLAPVVARIFTAIGTLAQTPSGFLDGVVIGIFKAGDTTLAANYRPITLLNTDYRLLARILASRLQQELSQSISPMQTAFIKKRRIGHNIITVQPLLHALPQDSSGGGTVGLRQSV